MVRDNATFYNPLGLVSKGTDPASVAALPVTDLPASERLHIEGEYERYDWRGHASFNKADFYDLFGPTKTGRKGYVVGVGRSTTLVYDEPRRLTLAVDGSFSGNLDRLPDFQNIPVDVNLQREALPRNLQPARRGAQRDWRA